MNLSFNISISERYRSASQIARVLTENWVEKKYLLSILWQRQSKLIYK
ncbi:DpnI domain-containing protein [uncultured Spirosoma sp.]